MTSLRSKIYSRLLRRALREGLLPGGEDGLALARSGERQGLILSMIMGKAQRFEPRADAKIARAQ